MKSTAIFTLLLTSSFCFSQAIQIDWIHLQGGNGFDQGAFDVRQTLDGGYIYNSTIYSTNTGDVNGVHGGEDSWLVKTDPFGNIVWQRPLGGPQHENGYGVVETADSGFITVGSAGSAGDDVSYNWGNYDLWVTKVDSTGAVVWDTSIGGTAEDRGYAIFKNNDESIAVVGTTKSTNGNIQLNQGLSDILVCKLSPGGAIIWTKTFGGSSADVAWAMKGTSDGGYIIAGETYSNNGDVTNNAGLYDYWVLKLDSLGDLQWQKTYGGSANDEAYSVCQTSDGGYIIAGGTYSNDGDISNNYGDMDLWIIKTDAAGNIQWEKSYGGTNYDYAESIIETSNNRFFVVGSTMSNDYDVSNHIGDLDGWVILLDWNGNILEEKCIGGSSADFAISIKENSNGMFILAGASESNDGDVSGLHGTNRDIMIAKLRILSNVGIDELSDPDRKVVSIVDPLGRQVTEKVNTTLIYIYSDGSTERIFKIE